VSGLPDPAALQKVFLLKHIHMISAVLFDIDGTLIQTGGAGLKAFAKTFEEVFGISNGTEKMRFAGRTDTGLVREFFKNNGIAETEENLGRFFKIYPRWLQIMLRECEGHVLPGVHAILDELEGHEAKPLVGLLTGNIRAGAELKLRHYDLWERFSFGGFADDHHERNQIAAAAHRRCEEHFCAPVAGDKIIVIGDTPLDIECGKAIGARTLAVATGGASLAELEVHRPTWLVSSLSQISVDQLFG
jgi:phosphoglycolate phosphatase